MNVDSIPWEPHVTDCRGTKVYPGDEVKVLRGVYKEEIGIIEKIKLVLNEKEKLIDVKTRIKILTRLCGSTTYYTTWKTGWLFGDALELVRRG